MGVCNSTGNSSSKKKCEEVIEDKDLNFEWTPEDTAIQTQKDSTGKSSIYRINAELYDHILDKTRKTNKIKKYLVCKYLYLDQYGKVFTQIPRKESKEIIKIEGNIDRKGLLRLKKSEQKIEGMQITNYEGQISRKISHLQIEGFATQLKSDQQSKKFEFTLDFSKTEWLVEFPVDGKIVCINTFLELNDNDNHISAISGVSFQEDKGFSVWKGIENDKRDITLTQQYVEDLKIASEDAIKIFYQGKIDRITNSIDGTIQGKDMDDIKFKITMKKKGKGKSAGNSNRKN